MPSQAPQVGDSANQLLVKLVNATLALGDSPPQSFQDAPADGKDYVRVNGAWVQAPDPVVDGVVDTYAALPVTLDSPAIDDVYLVLQATGVYFVNRHPAGLYARTANNGNLADWTYAATLTDSEE